MKIRGWVYSSIVDIIVGIIHFENWIYEYWDGKSSVNVYGCVQRMDIRVFKILVFMDPAERESSTLK